jgi:hypothetical protein
VGIKELRYPIPNFHQEQNGKPHNLKKDFDVLK